MGVMRSIFRFLGGVLALTSPEAVALEPVAVWDGLPGLGKKAAVNVSGIVCGPERDGERVCLVVYDEKRHARFFALRGNTFTARDEIQLLDHDPGVDRDDEHEADLEAVAYDSGFAWAFGSHSRKKTGSVEEKAEERPARRRLYRFPVDDLGRPTFAHREEERAPQVEVFGDLLDVLAADPLLAPIVADETPVDLGGLNIEGGTVVAGRMWLGLRAPLHASGDGDRAHLVGLDAAALFAGRRPPVEVHLLPLGKGKGIRDLAPAGPRAEDGLLVLAGSALPDDGRTRPPSTLWLWAGPGAMPVMLAELAVADRDAKPEAVTVLDATPTGWRVLVLMDGVKGGRPTEYLVPRPTP